MAVCKKCGVELEKGLKVCPLCNEAADQVEAPIPGQKSESYNPGYSPLTRHEKARLFWEIATLFHFSALAVTILIDLITSGKLSWSLYVATCVLASYIYITLITLSYRKLWIFLPGLLINSLGLLVLVDLFDSGINWFVNPGLPLAGFFVALLGLVMFYAYRARQIGFNIVAFAALAVAAYCILAEIFISLAKTHEVSLSWSVIVAACILPFSLFLFFFHYRLKRGTSLRRFFHL